VSADDLACDLAYVLTAYVGSQEIVCGRTVVPTPAKPSETGYSILPTTTM
jgi:hypothetical protein